MHHTTTDTLTAQDVRATADSASAYGRDELAAQLHVIADALDNPGLSPDGFTPTGCPCGCVRVVLTTEGFRCALCGARQ